MCLREGGGYMTTGPTHSPNFDAPRPTIYIARGVTSHGAGPEQRPRIAVNSQLGHVCERDRDGLENSQLDTVVKDHDFRLNGALCWCTSIDTPPRASPFAELFSGVGGFRFGG